MASSSPRKVKILYFAQAKQITGVKEEWMELPDNSTLKALKMILFEKYPKLQKLGDALAFAVNQILADDTYPFQGDEEIAVLPPISGG